MKKTLGTLLVTLCLFAAAAATGASDLPQPFVTGTMRQIVAAGDKNFLIVAFWSTDCTYCQEELALLAHAAQAEPRPAIALVATDPSQNTGRVAKLLRAHGFEPGRNWIFADDYTERLRFDIDRQWQGELPRTYLIAPGKAPVAISGRLDRARLGAWLQGR